jgi:hypothetical protein
MSKKVLNTQSVINELRGQSAFFKQDAPEQSKTDEAVPEKLEKPTEAPKKPAETYVEKETPKPINKQKHSPTRLSDDKKNDTIRSSASKHASTPVSMQADNQDDIVETIRKTVKQVGKEALFVRLTPNEKRQISSVVYAFNEMYRGEGRKTSENEIGRISINFLLEDYKANGEQSILAKVLAALNA